MKSQIPSSLSSIDISLNFFINSIDTSRPSFVFCGRDIGFESSPFFSSSSASSSSSSSSSTSISSSSSSSFSFFFEVSLDFTFVDFFIEPSFSFNSVVASVKELSSFDSSLEVIFYKNKLLLILFYSYYLNFYHLN